MHKNPSNKIRILVDAHGFGGEHQGSLTYIKGLYKALMANYSDDYELYFAGHDLEAMSDAFPEVGIDHFLLLESESRMSRLFSGYARLIQKYQIDYAHFQYLAPLKVPCKKIVTTHDVLFNDYPDAFSLWYRYSRNALFKWSLERSEIRLTVSNYSKEALCRHYGLPASSIAITPNAVSHRFFEGGSKAASQSYLWKQYKVANFILCVSRIELRKNHELLLRAYSELQLAKKGVDLVFIGNDTFRHPALDLEIEKLDSLSRQHFHWYKSISEEELIHFYRAASVFVYPSRAEGFGIPPLEAAVCGVPTLCSNATAMADFQFFGNHLFDPNDLEGLKQRLNIVLSTPPNQEELMRIAKEVRHYYSWTHAAEVLHGEIQRVEGKENKEAVLLHSELES